MNNEHFKPLHLNATPADLAGNQGIGRYILLPGSDGRAQKISQYFDNVSVKHHPRGHHLYLGTLSHQGKNIDVATVASGMGCPSMEIILHELFMLGGKRFLRVGTAGSLQPNIPIGSLINVQASVRDEQTTADYIPAGVPAIASIEKISAINLAAKQLQLTQQLYTGTAHCKSSFYAREFGAGPRAQENQAYMNLLSDYGVVATEMETATLFIQSQLYNHQLMQQGKGPQYRVLCGAILSIIAMPPHQFANDEQQTVTIRHSIELCLETIKVLSAME